MQTDHSQQDEVGVIALFVRVLLGDFSSSQSFVFTFDACYK